MKTLVKQHTLPADDAGRIAAVADAWSAAETAQAHAASACAWADRDGTNVDDVAEAVQAALRSRLAAERAEHCATREDAWVEASAAWAATTSAIEADARVVSAMVDRVVRAA